MSKIGRLGKILAGVAAVTAGASYTIVRKVYNDTYKRVKLEKYTDNLRYADVKDRYPRRGITFISGDNRLQGYIYGDYDADKMIVMAHGLYNSQEKYLGMIRALVDRGWTVFAFDNTGVCESEGKNGKGLVQAVLDLDSALTFIENDPELSRKRIYLIGHSQGGFAVCAVLNFDHNIAGVVSISGFTTTYQVQSEHGRHLYGSISVIMNPFIALEEKRRFRKYSGISSIEGINRSDIPVLIMHGTGDDFVDYNSAGIIHHKNEITNPNVTYMALDYPERNGHSDILYSLEGNRSANCQQVKLEALMKRCKERDIDKLPEEELARIYDGVDKNIASEYNAELYDTIDKYLRSI